jgi:hypothetical protein
MKKKIISILLSSFFVVSTTVQSFAFFPVLAIPVIAPEVIGIVSTLAVGTGIAFQTADDIYDLCNGINKYDSSFFDKMKKSIEKNGSIDSKGKIHVPSDIVKSFKDFASNTFTDVKTDYVNFGDLDGSYPSDVDVSQECKTGLTPSSADFSGSMSFNNYNLKLVNVSGKPPFNGSSSIYRPGTFECQLYLDDKLIYWFTTSYLDGKRRKYNYCPVFKDGTIQVKYSMDDFGDMYLNTGLTPSDAINLPYTPGSYAPSGLDGVLNKDGSADIYTPGNLDSLVGNDVSMPNATDNVYTPGKTITYPNVANPAVDVSGSLDIPLAKDTAMEGTNEGAMEGTTEGTMEGEWSNVFPPWGEGINFKPVTQNLKFADRFPFCLPSDLKNIIEVFNVAPKAPKFTVNIVTEKIEIDLTQFNVWANIIRFFIAISFVACLIVITRRLIS